MSGSWRCGIGIARHGDMTPCRTSSSEFISGRCPWPCEERQQFHEVWGATLDDLAAGGLQVGRGTFAGWDDADARLAGVTWCLARHLRPDRVVETGVARGVTTRVTLEALGRNGHGRLWSIDLPPLLERALSDETGAAVPPRLHERWSLLRGSSRRLLPSLVADVGQIDLFLHDSMHTTRNLEFELSQVWPALSPGGAALIDDVDKNVATGRFLQAHPDHARRGLLVRRRQSVDCLSDQAERGIRAPTCATWKPLARSSDVTTPARAAAFHARRCCVSRPPWPQSLRRLRPESAQLCAEVHLARAVRLDRSQLRRERGSWPEGNLRR